jgi:hypothetical protein
MHSNVVKFPSLADRGGIQSMHRRHRVEREARVREIETVELTETAKNSRLRDARKTAWHEAEIRVEYFHRRMEFECVVGRMQKRGLPERQFASRTDGSRGGGTFMAGGHGRTVSPSGAAQRLRDMEESTPRHRRD